MSRLSVSKCDIIGQSVPIGQSVRQTVYFSSEVVFDLRLSPPKNRKIARWLATNRSNSEFGLAASGGASAPEPAARHRGRTRVSTDFASFFSIFPEIGRLPPKI